MNDMRGQQLDRLNEKAERILRDQETLKKLNLIHNKMRELTSQNTKLLRQRLLDLKWILYLEEQLYSLGVSYSDLMCSKDNLYTAEAQGDVTHHALPENDHTPPDCTRSPQNDERPITRHVIPVEKSPVLDP